MRISDWSSDVCSSDLIGEKVDDTAHAMQRQFRDNRWPIAIAAAAGALWLLREPIKEHAPKLTRKIQDLAAEVADHFRVADEAADEDDKETLEEDAYEAARCNSPRNARSEAHTSELPSLMRI